MNLHVLQAKYQQTIFHNAENGYTVAVFLMQDGTKESFRATGILQELQEQGIYELEGYYEEHPRFGLQFKILCCTLCMPKEVNTLVSFFCSSHFPGVGKATATQIVEALGEDAIAKIKDDEHVLDDILSLTPRRKKVIVEGIRQYAQEESVYQFFSSRGLGAWAIGQIEKTYGQEAIAICKENPYRFLEDIDGIGFQTVDKLAKIMQFPQDHPYRLQAIIYSSIMAECMRQGDTYVEKSVLWKKCCMKHGIEETMMEDCLNALCGKRLLMIEEERIYHHSQYDAEYGIASFLRYFPYVEIPAIEQITLQEALAGIEDALSIRYDDLQKQAIYTFFQNPISILSGGPGTGKSTIVKGIVQLCNLFYENERIALCAPTGRAAKRLSQLTQQHATTIHSLLKWDVEHNTFVKDPQDPIEADILIIDEFSMVDSWLFYHLLRASKQISRILIIGDADQLPSVGPGCVLHDLIASKHFPTTLLQHIFRQREGSGVVSLAHTICKGQFPKITALQDVSFFETTENQVKNYVLKVLENAFAKGYSLDDIQVLAPMYQGVAGIDALNRAIQELVNPSVSWKQEFALHHRIFREGDKILQLRNQPEDQVFNGDIGILQEIVPAEEDVSKTVCMIVDFDGHFVEYRGEQIYHITHAYCISIHKAQGSEYPIVILPIVSQYRHMLQRRLLYTAVTRAKKSLVLLGEKQAFYQGIENIHQHQRNATLQVRLQDLCISENTLVHTNFVEQE